jgi:hypothetical protein
VATAWQAKCRKIDRPGELAAHAIALLMMPLVCLRRRRKQEQR